MAALATEIALRYSSTFLNTLTNVDSAEVTSITTAFRDAAIADAQAAFEIYAGVTFDSSDTRHVMIGCDGVIARLTQFGGQSRAQGIELWNEFVVALKALRKKGKPASTSGLERESDSGDKPYFEQSKMADYEPSSSE